MQCHQPPHPFLRRSPPVPSASSSDDPTTERISQDIFIIWWKRGWVSANIYLKSKISLCSIGGTGNFLLPLLAGIHSTIVILLCSARKSESANTHFSRKVLYSCCPWRPCRIGVQLEGAVDGPYTGSALFSPHLT